MDSWTETVRLEYLEDIRPPAFMYIETGEDMQSGAENRSTVIREHYAQLTKFLHEQGYRNLVDMIERLQNRRSEMREKLAPPEGRAAYVKAQQLAYKKKYEDEKENQPKYADSLLESLIGKAWLDEQGEIETSNGDGWVVEQQGADDTSEVPLSSMIISYRPEAPLPDDPALDKIPGRFEDPRPADQISFTGDSTWKEVFDTFKSRIGESAHQLDKISRTIELLDFRTKIGKIVLHRFEALGEVPEMTDEEAGALARQSETEFRRIETWQENAAYLYSFLHEPDYERPQSLKELEEDAGISIRQTWDQLKERGYGTGVGVDGLISALKEWAPEFQDRYGTKKANEAAHPGQWPDELEE